MAYIANVDLAEGGRRFKRGEQVNLPQQRLEEMAMLRTPEGIPLVSQEGDQYATASQQFLASTSQNQTLTNQPSYNQPQTTNLQDQINAALNDDEEFASELSPDTMQLMEAQKMVDQYLSENPTATRAEAEEAVGMNQVQGDANSQESQYFESVAQAQTNSEFADEVATPPKKSRSKKGQE